MAVLCADLHKTREFSVALLAGLFNTYINNSSHLVIAERCSYICVRR